MAAQAPFAAATSRFAAAGQALEGTLAAVHYANVFVRGRVHAVGADVEIAAELLDTIHDQAREAYATMYAEQEDDPVVQVLRDPKYIHGPDAALIEAWQAAMDGESPADRVARIDRNFRLTRVPSRRLAIAYKTFFIFVRAYQDAVYCLLNNSSTGSMGSALKNERSPVRIFLDGHLSTYVDWFPEFKKLRDKIKLGYAAALSGVGSPRGSGSLGLIVGHSSTSMSVYHLSDATTALEFSSQITDVTRELVLTRAAG